MADACWHGRSRKPWGFNQSVSLIMKKLLLISLSMFACLALRAELANVAGNGTPTSNRSLWGPGKWDIRKLIDGDIQGVFHLDTAPDAGAAYNLDLGRDYPIHEIRIYPRQDNCCPERLKQIRVSVHKDSQGALGAEVWGTDLFTDGKNAGATAGGLVKVTPPSPQTGRWIQIKSLEDPVQNYALQMNELEVYADVPASEVNRALKTLARSNRPLYGSSTASKLVDGDRGPGGAVVHGVDNIEAPFYYDVNLGTTVKLSRVVIWARQDACCPERLTNVRVSVHKDNAGKIGDMVWKATLHADGSNPGSDPGTKITWTANLDAAGTFQGQWIRVESLDNPIPNYALQMTEIEAYGEPIGSATLLVTGHPKDAAAGVGRTATFGVAASVPGGDATKIGYQWQKNGVDIAGATGATYTTPPLIGTDDNAKYRAVVSYAGLASQTTSEATLRINLAFQAKAFSNRPLWAPGGWNISKLVNGDRGDVFHLDTSPESGAAYEVDLGATVKMEEIYLWPRQDGCCPGRLTNFRVTVHKDNSGKIGDKVWSADFFTDGTNPGATAGSLVKIAAANDKTGVFEGQWVRIESLEEPIQNYALQMNELEVYGTFASQAALLSFVTEPADYGTAPGRSARFTTVAKVVNGDPAKITYQWQKNGVDIAGATSATYSTAPTTDADQGAKYRVVIGYAGAASVTSKDATISFDYNYAKGQPASSNRPLWAPGNWNIAMLTDGNRRGIFHLDTAPAVGAAYEIDLGGDVKIDKIDIYPRQDGCCPERFTNLRISVHKDNNGKIGDLVWKTDIYTDGTNPGAAADTVVTLAKDLDPAGAFQGQWVRILSLEDPVQNYALQMTEVEVYGRLASPIVFPIRLDFARVGAGLSLTWSAGTLEAAAEITGPFVAVPNATSPLNVKLQGQRQFYRVRR